MKTGKNIRENIGLMLTSLTILTQFLVTSAYESTSIAVDCDKAGFSNPDKICIEDLNRIETCKDKCGKRYDMPCSCDNQCVIYNNCCENMTYDCPEVLEEGKRLYGYLLGASIICTKDDYFMIDSCQQSSRTNGFDGKGNTTGEQETKDQRFIQLLANVPVTDTKDGITYRNSDSYFCYNNANASLVSWDVSFVLDALQAPTDLKSFENSISVDSVMYTPPDRLGDLPRQCEHFAVSHCQNSEVAQRQPKLETQCESLIAYVRTVKRNHTSIFYANRFCLECSEPEGVDFIPYGTELSQRVGAFFFSVLVSINQEDKVTLKVKHPTGFSLPNVMTWQTASCDLTKSFQISNTQLEESTGSIQDGLCDIGTCETGYEKRSDGQCKKLHVLEIGLADDEFPLTATDKEKLPFFMECALQKHVNTEVARVFVPTRVVFDKTLNKTLYLVTIAVYAPMYNIIDGIFKAHKTWTFQLAYVVKAFHEYRKTRALKSAAVPPIEINPMESMAKVSKTPSIATYDLMYSRGAELPDRGPRINNITTTICVRNPKDVMGCWEDPSYANEEKLITDLAQSSCFSQLQDSNHGVGNLASGQILMNQCFWKLWLLLGVGLVTALIP